jgi:hypothetical protein
MGLLEIKYWDRTRASPGGESLIPHVALREDIRHLWI